MAGTRRKLNQPARKAVHPHKQDTLVRTGQAARGVTGIGEQQPGTLFDLVGRGIRQRFRVRGYSLVVDTLVIQPFFLLLRV